MKFKERICARCGEKFIPNKHNQHYCHKLIFDKCKYCGKDIHYFCDPTIIQYCNSSCRSKSSSEKRRETASANTQICKLCGKEFKPINSQNVYCPGPHYRKCVICGKEFEFNVRRQSKNKTCSTECCQYLRFHEYRKMKKKSET